MCFTNRIKNTVAKSNYIQCIIEIYMLFTGREVRIGRYLPELMKMARGRRPRAIFMTEGKYLPIRTEQGR